MPFDYNVEGGADLDDSTLEEVMLLKLKAQFEEQDKNKTGTIQRPGLEIILKNTILQDLAHLEDDDLEEYLDCIWSEIDVKKTGKVTFDEMKTTLMGSYFTQSEATAFDATPPDFGSPPSPKASTPVQKTRKQATPTSSRRKALRLDSSAIQAALEKDLRGKGIDSSPQEWFDKKTSDRKRRKRMTPRQPNTAPAFNQPSPRQNPRRTEPTVSHLTFSSEDESSLSPEFSDRRRFNHPHPRTRSVSRSSRCSSPSRGGDGSPASIGFKRERPLGLRRSPRLQAHTMSSRSGSAASSRATSVNNSPCSVASSCGLTPMFQSGTLNLADSPQFTVGISPIARQVRTGGKKVAIPLMDDGSSRSSIAGVSPITLSRKTFGVSPVNVVPRQGSRSSPRLNTRKFNPPSAASLAVAEKRQAMLLNNET